ncbi:MAG TPA: VWA domain-containing protein [Solirubrobacteraceae bacterium]|nr:VWA domain-containing protein [Solirubrobacteraceae bacterium]
MSFQAPLLLAGLVLVPLALAAYVYAQRRRRRYAVRYTNVDLLAAAAGRDWARHLPAALALIALAALIIALARPQRVAADERREASVVMVFDHSGSMNNKDVAPTRMEAAKRAGRQLAAKLPQDFKLGLVVFGTRADQLVEPTTDKARVITALNGVKVRGYTAMGDALGLAIDAARVPTSGGTRPPARIVLLSDGASTRGADPITVAQRAKRYRIPVTTVALGNPPSDATTLQEIARTTGGRYYTVRDAQKLSEVYSGLGNRFSKLQAKQQVTAAFAGGALVFLLAGAGVGLVRGGRLP